MTSRRRNWLLLFGISTLLLGLAVIVFTQLQPRQPEKRPQVTLAPEMDAEALLRKRWRVQNTVFLMARAGKNCPHMSEGDFLARWRQLPEARRQGGRIDALALKICREPTEP